MKDWSKRIQYHRVYSCCFWAHFWLRTQTSLGYAFKDSPRVQIRNLEFAFDSISFFVSDGLRVVDNLNPFRRGNSTQTALNLDQAEFVWFPGKSGRRLLTVEIDRWGLTSHYSNSAVYLKWFLLFALLKEWFVKDFIALFFYKPNVHFQNIFHRTLILGERCVQVFISLISNSSISYMVLTLLHYVILELPAELHYIQVWWLLMLNLQFKSTLILEI